jgi:ribosomal protein S6--L-glutamate ligase
MRLCITGPDENVKSHTTRRLIDEAKKEFNHVDYVPILDVQLHLDSKKKIGAFYENKSLTDYDYVLPRIDSKRAAAGYHVFRILDDLDVRKPYPAETILIAHNKFITLEQMVKHGVPIPKTYMTASREAAKNMLKNLKLPVILKLLSGFGGEGVMFIESKEAAESTIDTMRVLQQQMLLEEYIPNPGEDVRGIVAGDEIIASYKRVAAKGEKKSNIHLGGTAKFYALNSDMQDLVLRAAEAIKAKICAIDMLVGKDGPLVIEANINPGLGGIEKTTSINVAQRIIRYVKSEVKR